MAEASFDLAHFPTPNVITPPQQPQNPPNDEDFRNAVDYENRVRDATTNVTPPWAVSLYNNINARFDALNTNINNRYDAIENMMREVRVMVEASDERFDRVEQSLSEVTSTAALAYNIEASDGRIMPFKEVPFPNGDLPSNSGLPKLKDLGIISGLTAQQATEFFQKYYVGTQVPHSIIDRKKAICRAVGCSQQPE